MPGGGSRESRPGRRSCRRAGCGTAGVMPSRQARRRRTPLLILTCCSSIVLVGLDSTAVNVALPSIGHDLRVPVPGLQWTVDIYALVLASLLMFSGATADRFGRRRIFQAGLS